RASASGAPKRKPRDSTAATSSTPLPAYLSTRISITRPIAAGSRRRGVISRKITPGSGKSGTAVISVVSSVIVLSGDRGTGVRCGQRPFSVRSRWSIFPTPGGAANDFLRGGAVDSTGALALRGRHTMVEPGRGDAQGHGRRKP